MKFVIRWASGKYKGDYPIEKVKAIFVETAHTTPGQSVEDRFEEYKEGASVRWDSSLSKSFKLLDSQPMEKDAWRGTTYANSTEPSFTLTIEKVLEYEAVVMEFESIQELLDFLKSQGRPGILQYDRHWEYPDLLIYDDYID